MENEHPVSPIESARHLLRSRSNITDKKVASREVVEMNGWIRGDTSLNLPTTREHGAEQIEDWLIDPAPDPKRLLSEAEDRSGVRSAPEDALALLDLGERHIVGARFLAEQPKTLAELAGTFGVSRERVRSRTAKGQERDALPFG
ncbi:hypothetical protein IVB12_03680 [Bradyrhizobium sp. 179]|uniref:sigma factor-like helix-turn-helix DNA-binding protein n=2 Tax=unclassified Bradyrhizobium TaxID=2631580 RepID=UPI001FF91CAC|nr:sigma factor-like helix-turn-helix DNA-binding protein [Bradyrhizobium sp. 179]MCK1541109.1 hypothetical protein [Bradyrhizobium sp. 179]